MKRNYVNALLDQLQSRGYYGILSKIIYLMYKSKGRDIRSVTFLEHLNVWEFKIGSDFFYSSGPGWAYDYSYLQQQFATHLGFHYMPKAGDYVVDVGAGVGEELMIFSRSVGLAGKVFAIEAHPKTFKALQYNKQRNQLVNTELLNVAVADASGHIYIEDTPDSLANKVSKAEEANGFKVDAITIEELVDRFELDRIDFMKVNIEGAEQLLIKGIGKAISKIRHMAISCHDFRYRNEGVDFFKTKDIILEFLRDNQFECITRNTNNPLLDDYVYARPRTK